MKFTFLMMVMHIALSTMYFCLYLDSDDWFHLLCSLIWGSIVIFDWLAYKSRKRWGF